MPARARKSGWRLAIAAVAALGVAAAGARWWAGEELLRELDARGVKWTGKRDTFGTVQLSGLSWKGSTAAGMRIELVPAPRVIVKGVDVDLRTIDVRGSTLSGPPGISDGDMDALGLSAVVSVEVEDLQVRLEDDVIASSWSGTLFPALSVEGAGGGLRRSETGAWEVRFQRDLVLGPASGQVDVEANCTDRCTITVDAPALVLAHPFLASAPLPPSAAHAEVVWDLRGDGSVEGFVQIGDAKVNLNGTATLDPSPAFDLDLELNDTPLDAIVTLFGDTVPEARRARMHGTLGATGHVSWPDGKWSLTPRFDQLAVEGVIPDVDGLKYGQVSWAAPDEAGVPRLRRTGEGIGSFIPYLAAGLFPHAVLAAEDSGFSRHHGIDPVAIQAAIDGAREHGIDRMRGGSTITQQLAKNLFLDTRERTLARKLRELLYTLELDRVLPKQRILELYINVVELGDDIYGVGPAARAYFLKQPARLTVTEVAFLAALLPAPRSLARRAWHGGRTPKSRMNVIIDNMADMDRIKPLTAAEAKRTTLRLVPPP